MEVSMRDAQNIHARNMWLERSVSIVSKSICVDSLHHLNVY